jgi:hypothetical protein
MKGSKLAKPQNVENVEEENQNLKKLFRSFLDDF